MIVRRRALLAAALAATTAPTPTFAADGHIRVPVSATPISRLDTSWWRARHEAVLTRVRQGRVDLLWVGDSITQDWEHPGPPDWDAFAPVWRRFYGDRNAVNLGFKGDNTSHLLWRLQNGEVDNISPKAAVLLIGANDMGLVHWNAEQCLAGITACVDELRRRLPSTPVLLLGVLPSLRSDYVTRTTARINHDLEDRYAAGRVPGVTYMDVGPIFLRNGQLDRTQFLDDRLTPPDRPLHPTAQAQAEIAEAIEPTLSRLMGVPSKLRS